MHIIHIVHRYPPALGGAEAYFARLSRYLAAAGDRVTVHTTNALDLEAFWWKGHRMLSPGESEEAGVTVHRHAIRHWPLRRYQLKLLSLIPIRPLQCLTLPCNPIAPTMRTLTQTQGPVDLVHATAFPYAYPILCGLRLAQQRNVPFVLTPFLHLGARGAASDRSRKGYLSSAPRYLLHAADRVVAQTHVEAMALKQIGVPDQRIVVQGMGVDPAECTGGERAAARQRWNLPLDAVVIGHLANKSVEKGTVDLLAAVKLLWQRGVDSHLLLAGPEMPNFTEHWRRQERSLTTDAGRIIRLQELTDGEKRDFFAATDIFAMPSRSDSFGIVFLEAWANGKPCVAYRIGGVAEVIRENVDGLLAAPGDVPELATQLQRCVADASLRTRLGEAGRERVLRENAWVDKLELVRRLYQELVRAATH
jgi:glycosyltransferase involved in cell wall biosynthesis